MCATRGMNLLSGGYFCRANDGFYAQKSVSPVFCQLFSFIYCDASKCALLRCTQRHHATLCTTGNMSSIDEEKKPNGVNTNLSKSSLAVSRVRTWPLECFNRHPLKFLCLLKRDENPHQNRRFAVQLPIAALALLDLAENLRECTAAFTHCCLEDFFALFNTKTKQNGLISLLYKVP